MDREEKRYQLGNYVSVNGKVIAEITSLSKTEVGVQYKNGEEEKVPWHHIYPIYLSTEKMSSIGFSHIRSNNFNHHQEVIMDVRINGKFYNARGIILEDRSLWSFNNVSVRFLHQVQSLIWILEPFHKFDQSKM